MFSADGQTCQLLRKAPLGRMWTALSGLDPTIWYHVATRGPESASQLRTGQTQHGVMHACLGLLQGAVLLGGIAVASQHRPWFGSAPSGRRRASGSNRLKGQSAGSVQTADEEGTSGGMPGGRACAPRVERHPLTQKTEYASARRQPYRMSFVETRALNEQHHSCDNMHCRG